jgi:hypothetical protein
MPELLSTIPVIEEKRKTPSATDNDYSVFECVMLHENKGAAPGSVEQDQN